MSNLDHALNLLTDEFDAFIILGSMHNPLTGSTTVTRISKGNAYAIEGMIARECEGTLLDEEDDESEERDS